MADLSRFVRNCLFAQPVYSAVTRIGKSLYRWTPDQLVGTQGVVCHHLYMPVYQEYADGIY